MTSGKLRVDVFCDGACRGNPGPGGWGSVIRSQGKEKELAGFDPHTTNNKMELAAAIESLRALKSPSEVIVRSDSQYVVKGMTSWIFNWQKKNWLTANKKPVKNKELWQALAREAARHHVTWEWVKGHSGHPENERADELANKAIDRHS